MSPTAHLIQGSLSGAVLYPFIGYNAIIVGISTVAIDTDHYIEYYLDTKQFNIAGMFERHEIIVANLDNFLGLNLFHTIECYLLLFILAQLYPQVSWILCGFLFHHLFDQLLLTQKHKPFARAFSIFEYFIRKRIGNYHTSVYEVMEKNNQLI
jgi:hypothetical protein